VASNTLNARISPRAEFIGHTRKRGYRLPWSREWRLWVVGERVVLLTVSVTDEKKTRLSSSRLEEFFATDKLTVRHVEMSSHIHVNLTSLQIMELQTRGRTDTVGRLGPCMRSGSSYSISTTISIPHSPPMIHSSTSASMRH
jgi:hypothetical protein